LLPRLIAVAAGVGDEIFVLSSMGEVFRISNERELQPITRLPLGQYHRISMVAAPDGVLVSGGFHVGSVFHVSRAGVVRTLAEHLADPQGIAFDGDGYLYVAESAMHRVIRVRFP
jgi:sugar lactone lactonase YvrE